MEPIFVFAIFNSTRLLNKKIKYTFFRKGLVTTGYSGTLNYYTTKSYSPKHHIEQYYDFNPYEFIGDSDYLGSLEITKGELDKEIYVGMASHRYQGLYKVGVEKENNLYLLKIIKTSFESIRTIV